MTLTGHIVGTKGNTGRGIASIVENADYTITINLTDGSSYTTAPIAGFTAVELDEDYNLVITKTDGTTETVETNLADYQSELVSIKEDAEAAQGLAETARNQSAAQALKSEGFAVGEQSGTPVSSGDYYHNNAKYYAEQAAASETTASEKATAASGSASAADGSAKDAEAYAVGKRGGTDVSSGDAAYHNNAKYYAEQAASTLSAAETAIGNAKDTAIGAVQSQQATSVGAVQTQQTASVGAVEAAGDAKIAELNTIGTFIYVGSDGNLYYNREDE